MRKYGNQNIKTTPETKPNGSKLQMFSQLAQLVGQFGRKAEENEGGCKTCNPNPR